MLKVNALDNRQCIETVGLPEKHPPVHRLPGFRTFGCVDFLGSKPLGASTSWVPNLSVHRLPGFQTSRCIDFLCSEALGASIFYGRNLWVHRFSMFGTLGYIDFLVWESLNP